ncbi:Zn(II)2Cys6 transcription factor [Fusarium albosuccineum]|uniref:Zn(II)2Cys6 transcription factor n=1 Tax=Fusarium albosuccineum TaxID=1237068 RepID=A0A8H4PAL4_9HYPO|nr:Zn(II)2Cys6 transcription factor [Fusarium albosuccineum]
MDALDAKANGCDEQKPACGRCVRAGVECPGYGQKLRWSTKYEVLRPDAQRKPRQKPSKPSVEDSSPSSSSDISHGFPNTPLPDRRAQNTVLADSPPNQAGLSENLFDNIPLDLPEISDLPDLFGAGPAMNELSGTISIPNLGQNPLDFNTVEERVTEEQLRAYDPSMHSPTTSPFGMNTPSNPPHTLPDTGSELVTAVMPYTRANANNMTVISPARPLNDPSSILVEFYFKETAQLFSCYDSPMNPFRTTVSRLWNTSPLLYKTLSSMAAASFVDDFPQLGALGRQLRREAIHMLDRHTGSELDALLAMLMLGGSASWHDHRDLGLSFFNRIRKKLASIPIPVLEQHGVDYQFFHQSMTYWELLLAYVADDDELHASSDKALVSPGCLALNFVPHPWTGFARDTQNVVQKIGRLIRRQRKLAFSRKFTSLAHINQLEKDMETASELEQYLTGMSHPAETTVHDPEDRNTPVWHLLALAEAYRSTGLIQLYHIFPDLLDRRLIRDGVMTPDVNDEDDPETDASKRRLRNDWLTTYALQVLGIMKSIPLESGTRDFQPFLLVSLSSELRSPPTPMDIPNAGPETNAADQMADLTSQAIEVSRMRHFIKSRLSSFLHILPPKPIHICLNIVNTTWKLMDERARLAAEDKSGRGVSCLDEEVYWMDVMIENGWETTMA